MLTDTQVRNTKPKEKPYKLPKELGLYLLVNPNGSKLWRLAYSFNRKEKSISLGAYPGVPLSLARQRRDIARKQIAEGIDPSAQRQAERDAQAELMANNFAEVMNRWAQDENSANSEEYQATVRRMLERDVLPYIGERPLEQIKTRDLIKVFDRIRSRGVEETARRARTIVGQIFRYAIRRGIVEHDPTHALKGERRI